MQRWLFGIKIPKPWNSLVDANVIEYQASYSTFRVCNWEILDIHPGGGFERDTLYRGNRCAYGQAQSAARLYNRGSGTRESDLLLLGAAREERRRGGGKKKRGRVDGINLLARDARHDDDGDAERAAPAKRSTIFRRRTPRSFCAFRTRGAFFPRGLPRD